MAKGYTTKIGRDAKTGRFIPVKQAMAQPKTTVVETIKRGKKPQVDKPGPAPPGRKFR